MSGYIHKFRLDGSQETEPSNSETVVNRFDKLPLIVVTSIAVGLLMLIGALTL